MVKFSVPHTYAEKPTSRNLSVFCEGIQKRYFCRVAYEFELLQKQVLFSAKEQHNGA